MQSASESLRQMHDWAISCARMGIGAKDLEVFCYLRRPWGRSISGGGVLLRGRSAVIDTAATGLLRGWNIARDRNWRNARRPGSSQAKRLSIWDLRTGYGRKCKPCCVSSTSHLLKDCPYSPKKDLCQSDWFLMIRRELKTSRKHQRDRGKEGTMVIPFTGESLIYLHTPS